jgi:hypothetical protein
MRANRLAGVFGGLLLLVQAGIAEAGREGRQESRSPHQQIRGMVERLHDRGDGRHGDADHRRDRHHDRGRHDSRRDSDRERHLYWGHERWRDGTERRRHFSNERGYAPGHQHYGRRHSPNRGYWQDFHHGHRHHHHGYRHRVYNHYHYYYNSIGFYFPGYGHIAHGHLHGVHCPHWHFEDFAAGFILGAIIYD